MSYDIGLYPPQVNDPSEEIMSPLQVDAHEDGGTFVAGGTTDAWLNVTYNYSECYRLFEFSLTDLDRKTASETEERLADLVEKLGTARYPDYWAPTPGNAGHALSILLGWARQHPDGVWSVS